MSAKKPIWSWRRAIAETDAPPLTKLLCYTFALDLSDSGKFTRTSIAELCRLTGLSERSIGTHIANAVTAQLLTFDRVRNTAGHVIGTHYFPRFPDRFELAKDARETSENQDAYSASRAEMDKSLDAYSAVPKRISCVHSIDTSPNTSPIKEARRRASATRTAANATGEADAGAEAMRKRFGATLKDIGRKMRAKSTTPEPGTDRAAELVGRRVAIKDPRQTELEDAIRQAPARAAR